MPSRLSRLRRLRERDRKRVFLLGLVAALFLRGEEDDAFLDGLFLEKAIPREGMAVVL